MASYEGTARSFDALARRYDAFVESNPLHAALRTKSLAWLDEAFRPGMRVVDVGCGTGTEAVHLARRGVDVVATDVSPKMVEATRARITREALEGRVAVVECAAADLADRFPSEAFDGAFASFGPLNCQPDPTAATASIARVIRPEAPFLFSVVSRPAAIEIAAGIASLRPRKAFRRLSESVAINLYGSGTVRARSYSEGAIRSLLAQAFVVERIEGWLVVRPPPYLAGPWTRLRSIHTPLERLDDRLGRLWPFRAWGDHLHVWARRRAA